MAVNNIVDAFSYGTKPNRNNTVLAQRIILVVLPVIELQTVKKKKSSNLMP